MNFLVLLLFFFQNPKPEIQIPDLERLIHQSVNVLRQSEDRAPLAWDDQLANFARAHSEDMAKRGYFKHVTPEGLSPMKRLEQAGYDQCRLVGENIYQNNLYSRVITEKKKTTYDWSSMEQISESTMHGWITSPSHKQTMLDEKYTRQGIGVAVASDDKVYITELFCSEIN